MSTGWLVEFFFSWVWYVWRLAWLPGGNFMKRFFEIYGNNMSTCFSENHIRPKCTGYHVEMIFGRNRKYFQEIAKFCVIEMSCDTTLSAPYDKCPWGAPIISFIFVGNFTILFFFVFFSKLGNSTAYHSTTAYHSKTAYHSTTGYRSNLPKTLFSAFPGCSLIIRRTLIIRWPLVIRTPLIIQTLETAWKVI